MKAITILLLFALGGLSSTDEVTCTVWKIFTKERTPSLDMLVQTNRGEIKKLDNIIGYEVKYLLKPATVKAGTYRVKVEQHGDYYEDTMSGMIFETSICNKWGFSRDAIFSVMEYSNGVSMQLVFPDCV